MQCKLFKIINIYLDFIQLYEFLVGYKIIFLPLKEPHFLLAVSCSVELYLKQGHELFSVGHHSTGM
jgi:hypothetical protein